DRIADQFRNKRGRDRVEWTPGSIRDRANALAQHDEELGGLADLYELLYGTLSDYEHSAPVLCFFFVQREDRDIFAAPDPTIIPPDKVAQALGVLVGALVAKTMGILGLSADDFRS